MGSHSTSKIRVATLADVEAICQLNQRNGMGANPEVWRSQWEGYPFASEFKDVPTGWLLEAPDGRVVGNLDNVHMLYDLGGRRIKGAVAAGWAVDIEYRSDSLQLMTTFFRQRGVDLCLGVSASPVASRILTAMKISRIPIPEYGTPCFWAVHSRAFARAVLTRRSIRGAALWAWPAGLALRLRDVYRRSGRGRLSSSVRRLQEFDERFDRLWDGNTAVRLRAVRNRAVLEWRFREDFRNKRVAIIASEQGRTLLGYAILVRRDVPDWGMLLYDVADIQSSGDHPEIFRDLLLGAIGIAREDGLDAVKFMSGTPSKRAPADALHPYTYRLPFWQQYFRTGSSELSTELATADAWDFSLFDTY